MARRFSASALPGVLISGIFSPETRTGHGPVGSNKLPALRGVPLKTGFFILSAPFRIGNVVRRAGLRGEKRPKREFLHKSSNFFGVSIDNRQKYRL
jgi:hypothetical protein